MTFLEMFDKINIKFDKIFRSTILTSMGGDHPMEMVLLIFICLFGISSTTKGTFFITKKEVLKFLTSQDLLGLKSL